MVKKDRAANFTTPPSLRAGPPLLSKEGSLRIADFFLSNRAFTLLETLIATAISVVVLLVLLSAYHGFTRALEKVGQKQNSPALALAKVEGLLISGIKDGMVTNELAFGLSQDVHSNAVLIFYRAAITAKPPDAVISRVVVNSEDGRLKNREAPVLPERSSDEQYYGEERTNEVLRDVSSFTAMAYYQQEEYSIWPSSNCPPWPEAVYLEIQLAGQTNIWSTEMILPVGWSR